MSTSETTASEFEDNMSASSSNYTVSPLRKVATPTRRSARLNLSDREFECFVGMRPFKAIAFGKKCSPLMYRPTCDSFIVTPSSVSPHGNVVPLESFQTWSASIPVCFVPGTESLKTM